MHDRNSTRFNLLVPIGFVAFGILLAWLTGRLQLELVRDSNSYLTYSFASLDSIGREFRMPGYPLWLWFWQGIAGLDYVPLIQTIAHGLASAWFAIELRRLGMPSGRSVVAGISIGIGCTAIDNVYIISTDALAASAGVCTASALLRWSDTKRLVVWGLLTSTFAVVAIMLRPAYLCLIPWMFIAGAMLRFIQFGNLRSSLRSSFSLSFVALAPVLAWMILRFFAVGDFAILPFGHQNLGAILVQLVSEEELVSLPGEAGQLGRVVVDSKRQYLNRGGTFPEGDPQATMTIEGSWDDMTYRVLVPAADSFAGDDIIVSHHLIATMNKAIIKQYPKRYVVWVVKNLRRGAWAIAADMVMHPVFLAVIGLSLLGCVYRSIVETDFPSSSTLQPGDSQTAVRALTIVAITYLIAMLGFVALTTPTVGRFSDAAAIFMPAWLFASKTLFRWSSIRTVFKTADPI